MNNLSGRLSDLGRREDALAASQDATAIRRELAARWPDAHRYKLEQSLRVAAWREHGKDPSNATRKSLRSDNPLYHPVDAGARRYHPGHAR